MNHQSINIFRVVHLFFLGLLFPFVVRAATYEVGPGLACTNLAAVPWNSLAPGDTVNIHYQAGGYHEVILLSNSGVSNAPVTINGVADPITGALPVIDGQNAITPTNTWWHDTALNTAGVLVISRAANQPAGNIPSWLVIQNLHVQNASPDFTLTQFNGTAATFDSTAAGIFAEFAQHIVIRGCEINGAGNGVFIGSKNNDPNEVSADILIEHCRIHDNGYPGNYQGGNLNMESKGIRVQYNLIGPLRSGASGDQIIDHSSGTVLAYNQITVGPDGGAAFWFSQTENAIGIIDADPAYRTNFVYGNVFLNPTNSTCQQMFVYDTVYIQAAPRNGTLYFYNNTVVNLASAAQRYNAAWFSLPTSDEVQQWSLHDTLDCRNNIFANLASQAGDTPTYMTFLASDASTVNFGTNWLSPGFQYYALPYGSNVFLGTITGTNQLLIGDRAGLNAPGFANANALNFSLLASSPAMDAAGPQAPAVQASPNNLIYEYVYPSGSQLKTVNGLGLDLGALEGVSTNISGALFTLTVSNGFGGGSYPAGAVVPVTASNAPAGQGFAGWANYPVANPSVVGTTLVMPGSNVLVTAVFTNLPPRTNFLLTVINGVGSGYYPAGQVVNLTSITPPAGETFTGWTGFPVAATNAASTTLTMTNADATVMANFQFASAFHLTVVNGTGSGSYVPGTTVNISASNSMSGEVFDGWTGLAVANFRATNTSLVMPAADAIVTAKFLSTNDPSFRVPYPVASHPRLWITTNDLPRLRAWATPTNPIYLAVRNFLTNSMIDYETQYFPGGVQNTNYPDFGDGQGYVGLLTEEDAIALALFSLIDPDTHARAIYAQRAADLIRVVAAQAALGTLTNAPFRDPSFATYNRANATLKLFPLAVDWIYNAVGTNGQPVLSAADKRNIRDAFMAWCETCRHASTAYGDSPIPDVVNDPTVLCPNNAPYRMAANNYYLGHARMLTLMSLAIDPEDDPPLNPDLPVGAITNSLRSYINIVNGAWLFQEYAMFGEGDQVAQDYGLPGYGANFGITCGGMPPEGMLYGASVATMMQQLLALQTAGFNNTNYTGPQIKLAAAPLWDRFCDAWLNTLTPELHQIEPYFAPAYQMFGYGDTLRLFSDPDFSTIFSPMMMMDYQTGNTNRLAKTRWLSMEVPDGGFAELVQRAGTSWGGNQSYEAGILYFLSLDPATLTPPPDPRPTLPTVFYDPKQGSILGQSDWTTNRSMLHWRCCWISINHEDADGGMFQFLRKNEFLTKEFTGYDANDYGQCSLYHNTLALQNYCTAGTPNNLSWYESGLWNTGSQWQLAGGNGDPTAVASCGTNYIFTFGDMTPLYNRPSPYSPENACLDIQQANRSLLWLKPDHLVIYDRATSRHDGLFKRFNLCLPASPVATPVAGNGSLLTETLPSGQQLFIRSLLPTNGVVSQFSLSNAISTVAEGEPCNFRLALEDTNHPADTRFLHVLQGADAGVAPDATTYLQSSAGNAFEGVAVRGADVLFPVNLLSNNFTGMSFLVPAGATNHYIAGLSPNARYDVTLASHAGQWQVTVTPGTQLTADNAGLLVFDHTGASPQRNASQWSTLQTTDGAIRLLGVGQPLLSYQVQMTTNLAAPDWFTVGTVTADGGGKVQYSDFTPTTTATRFYRLAR